MNYLPWVSWGVFKGANAYQRAHYFVSWGLMGIISGYGGVSVGSKVIPTIPTVGTQVGHGYR
jgi:hypothetical protein